MFFTFGDGLIPTEHHLTTGASTIESPTNTVFKICSNNIQMRTFANYKSSLTSTHHYVYVYIYIYAIIFPTVKGKYSQVICI